MNENEDMNNSKENNPDDISKNENSLSQKSNNTDKESNFEETNKEPENKTYAFNWHWEGEKPQVDSASAVAAVGPKKKKKFGGGALFAVIMASVFFLAFVVLVISLITDTIIPSNGDFGKVNVNINVSQTPAATPNGSASQEVIESVKQSTVLITVERVSNSGTGSGVIMDDSGYIITNYHVVESSTKITVKLYNGKKYSATYIGGNERDDIAVIKISASGLHPATFGGSEDCVVYGETVYALGAPGGRDFGWTITRGIVSYPKRTITVTDDNKTTSKKMTLIQTDTAVNPGNSGGPLFNTDGVIIGIVTLKLDNEYVGMNFAIPSYSAINLARAIIKGDDNYVSEISSNVPVIGVTVSTVSSGVYYRKTGNGLEPAESNETASFKADVSGAYVMSITKGTDAKEKLKAGDIIIEIDGVTVESIYDVSEALVPKMPGDVIEVVIYRNGKNIHTQVKLN